MLFLPDRYGTIAGRKCHALFFVDAHRDKALPVAGACGKKT